MSETKSSKVFLFAAILLLGFMTGHDSLWIDEAYNASYARLSTFREFLDLFLAGTRSENQMPLGMFASWVGGRLVGTSEFQLRAINWFWGLLAIFSFWGVGRRLQMPWLPLFAACQPFLWFYMGEARPYAMQTGCSTALMFALLECLHTKGKGRLWVATFALAGVVLCGSSLLGVIPFAVICLALIWVLWQARWKPDRFALICLSLCLLILAGLGVFYAWTLSRGTGGAKLWHVGINNIAFALWEFAGFSGLGPTRQLLRELASQDRMTALELLKHHLPYIGFLAAVYAAVIALGWTRFFSTQSARISTFVWTGSFTALTGAALVVHFPFWGRHLAPAFPFFVLSMAHVLAPSFGRKTKPLLVVLMSLLFFSSLELRFAPRHAKDNYRAAAELARAALSKGSKVLWVADNAAAEYYGVPISVGNVIPDRALQPRGDQQRQLAAFGLPDLVVLSKPSIYDAQGFARELLEKNRYQRAGTAQAFEFWRKP